MSEHSIEILGQKLSYPSNWHGVAAVFIVCSSIVAISYFLDEKRIGAIGKAVAGVKSALQESEASNIKAQETIKNQAQEIENLTQALSELNKQSDEKVQFDPDVFRNLQLNREKTTKSFSDYLSSQDRLNEKLGSLELQCPDCVSGSSSSITPELRIRLDALKNQQQVLELQR
ncbi:hypothetical protein [Neptunomonas phycophila]|uniref:hypothetical protein n=1 Tax=Neptunomonas phycophila TaxID=1572645 RepID=UPI0015C0FE99|nr:hypothetical protein [Neptunomonas phycophila]QLE97464.1 hypothetical protein FLM49_07445 [Neptunomonas phycophila]